MSGIFPKLNNILIMCLVGYLRESQHQCPICEVELTEQEVNNCCLFWDNSSFKIDIESLAQARAELSGPNDANSVKALKYALKDATNIDISKQKLMYNDMELNDFQDDSTNSTLENYGIHANSHIQLIVVLYSITQDQALTNLVFDLYWGFPHSGQDFLDARGHHNITTKLDNLPNEVGQLYLILSSWRSPTIGHFRNPSFKLHDEADPDKQLCNYIIEQAKNSQAVIMCLINRSNNGMWHVIEVGDTSSGNAKDYDPIEKNISRLMWFNKIL
ncbi:hypothetical protein C2G38_2303101 [Gigaspora rosea]|uniref:Ubiquitin-like domain-containing protein n=1 Tax=Gigaspora rosea TaxID=44941 RepID=A0A397VI72_9GLOM|nr:hypothetical protein C2G38_2303101 [Gigaspora rosea]